MRREGETVSGDSSYAFFAPGPWPRSLTPRPGAAIEEDQAFLIDASGALKSESVERNVWCEADGVGNRISVRVLPDSTRNAILATLGYIFGHRQKSPNQFLHSFQTGRSPIHGPIVRNHNSVRGRQA